MHFRTRHHGMVIFSACKEKNMRPHQDSEESDGESIGSDDTWSTEYSDDDDDLDGFIIDDEDDDLT